METMKKEWGKPLTQVKVFRPQEYCGSCEHDSGGTLYHFQCNAGVKEGYRQGYIYKETNNLPGLQSSSTWVGGVRYRPDQGLGYFQPNPNVNHWAPTTDEFEEGYFLPTRGYGFYDDSYAFSVIIWRGDGDLHATSELDMDKWEKNVS